MYQINDIVHYTVASTLETAINAPTFAPKLLGLASASRTAPCSKKS